VKGSRVLQNLASGLGGGAVVFALTYFLIAVPAQDASDRSAREARELSGVQAAKTDVHADLEILARSNPPGHRVPELIVEAAALFRLGNTALDQGGGSYATALKSYNAALIKLRKADALRLQGRPSFAARGKPAKIKPNARPAPSPQPVGSLEVFNGPAQQQSR
jgi:hypothetical protein